MTQRPENSTAKAEPNTVVLGVDPGLRRTGYALLAVRNGDYDRCELIDAGIVRLDAVAPLAHRLLELEADLQELIRRHRPFLLACEELYSHYKHPRTAILMGHARGVILALAARNGLLIEPVPATQAKKLLTGNGHASKTQMQRAVAATLCLTALPEPHDVADAIAIGLCGARLHAASVGVESNAEGAS